MISALMMIPVAASQQLFTGFRVTLSDVMRIGILAAFGGTFGPYHWNTATGATIVMVATALLGIATLMGTFLAPNPHFIPFISPYEKKKRILAKKPTGTGPPFG